MSQIAIQAYREDVEIEVRRAFKASDIHDALIVQGGCCAWCDEPLTKFEADHAVPRALGGKTERANLQLLCPPHHLEKTRNDRRMIAKAERLRKKLAGQVTHRKAILSRGFQTHSKLYRSVDGQVRERK